VGETGPMVSRDRYILYIYLYNVLATDSNIFIRFTSVYIQLPVQGGPKGEETF